MSRSAPVPVLTAVTDAAWESGLVAELTRSALGVTVVRRCVDLADLLATDLDQHGIAGTGRFAIGLRGEGVIGP